MTVISFTVVETEIQEEQLILLPALAQNSITNYQDLITKKSVEGLSTQFIATRGQVLHEQ
jgi:hypothetical protein